MAQPPKAQAEPTTTGDCAPGVVPLGSTLPPQAEPVPSKRPAHYLWADWDLAAQPAPGFEVDQRVNW